MNEVVFQLGPYGINGLAAATLAAAAGAIAVGVYVLLAEREERESLFFFLICAAAALWLVPASLMYSSPTIVGARTWAQVSFVPASILPVFVHHFTVELLDVDDRRRRMLQAFLWMSAGSFAMLFIGGVGIGAMRRFPWGWFPRYGVVGRVWGLFVALVMAAAIAEYVRGWRRAPEGKERDRIRWFLVAFALAAGCLFDLLPANGISVPPLSSLFVLAFLVVTAWTVLRYRLVDLTPAFAARSVLETIGDPLLVCDDGGRIRVTNPAVRRVLGYEPAELTGRPLEGLLPDDPERRGALRRVLRSETVRDRELTFRSADGEPVATSISVSPLVVGGERVGSVVVARDIRERKAAEEALRISEEKFAKVFEVTPLAVSIATLEEGRFLEVNQGFEQLYGWDREEAVGRTALDLGLWTEPADREELRSRLRARSTVRDFETRLETRAGDELHVLFSAEKIELQGETCLVAAVHDITERKRFEAELRRQALYDDLTGLPNRQLLLDRLRRAAAEADRADEAVAVLYVDVDDFKRVNDTLGYQEGDRVLEEVADRLAEQFREDDTLARVGGDEFAVLLRGVGSADEARKGADRLQDALSAPIEVDGEMPVRLETQVGIELVGGELDRPEEAVRFAHVAMHRAKEEDRRAVLFDPDVDTSAMRRLHRENELRRALERDEIFVVYQPVVALEGDGPMGVEALARWRHPERGVVSPADFIPLAEESGLIGELGGQVLEEAAAQVGEWRRSGPAPDDLRMSVNLSPSEFRDPGLPERVVEVLERAAVPPERFLVEITENTIVQGRERVRQLRERGVHVGVDDFGTGYSSLAYLETLEVDYLKVDRSFVADLDRDPPEEELVRTILQLADALDLTAVAEGIETERQLARLRELGCPFGQGYLFSRPLAAGEMESWFRNRGRSAG